MTTDFLQATCERCGAVRLLKSNHKPAALCMSCANSENQQRAGHKPPREIVCKVCGKIFVARGYRIAPKFCSRKCYGVEMRTTRLGFENPNAKHLRRSGGQIRGWSLQEKGETACRVCGSIEMLALHHIIPRSKWAAGKRDLRNGVALCSPCHGRWHRGKREITRDFFTTEEWSFVSSADLIGERTKAWLNSHYPPPKIS